MERFETRQHLFEEKYKMKMNKLKLLAIKNQDKVWKVFIQPKLSFSKAPKKDSPESQVPTSNEDGNSNNGRFHKKCFKLTIWNTCFRYFKKLFSKIYHCVTETLHSELKFVSW